MVRKIYALFTLAVISLSVISGPLAYAQSGRGRTANPARDPKPAAAPPVTVPDATSVIKQEQAGAVSRFLLKNGITVIINEQHASPITATVAYFKAGALDETEALSGAAALLARTLFRGTQLQTAEQITAKLRAGGALMEAQAGFDNSSFYLIAPPDKLKEALAIQADVLQHPALNADNVRKEIALNSNSEGRAVSLLLQRNNALSELFECSVANREAPENLAMAGLLRVALAANKPFRGWQNNSSMTAEQLMSFYKTHYRPDNLIITVTGDVSTFHTLVEIQRLYGTFKAAPQIPDSQTAPQPAGDRKAGEAPATNGQNKAKPAAAATLKPKAKAEGADKPKAADAGTSKKPEASGAETNSSKPQAPQTAPANAKPEAQPVTADTQAASAPQTPLQYGNERGNTGQSIISVGYRFAALDAKERATIEVLCALLGQGRASRLHRSLVEGQGLAQRIDAAYFALADASMLALQMQIAPNLIDRAESAFFREVNTLRRETPSEGEMTRAKMLLEKRFFDKNATYIDRAWVLARAEATQGGIRAFADYRKRLEAARCGKVSYLCQHLGSRI
jgi:predicted Zn-dependent peptidase